MTGPTIARRSCPPADPVLFALPPADPVLFAPPPADPVLSAPPPDAQSLPPADPVLFAPLPADPVLATPPPVDPILSAPPPAAPGPAPATDSPSDRTTPPAKRSLALEHDGRIYAFGARWLAFGRPDRREIRKSLREAHATHWIRIQEGETEQVAAYDLPEERGRIFAAMEAVRTKFGGDFLGLFELGGDSFQRVYWLAAISEEIVLADSLHETLEEAQAVCSHLLAADRTFGTTRLPEGFAGSSGEAAGLDDFLGLSETSLRRAGTRPWPILLASGLGLAVLGAAGFGLLDPAPASVPPPVAQNIPVFPEYMHPESFAFACEKAVASGIFRASAGWSLTAAKCLPDRATLRFANTENASTGPEIEIATAVRLDSGSKTADVWIPLAGPRERLRPPPGAPLLDRLRARLKLVDRQYRLERRQDASSARLYETHHFAFATAAPAPTWLALFGDGRGVEFTSASFAPESLRWRVEGRIHVLPE